jgi:3D (Asp-Asp-Asp) domain-containing protein/peptidoglycan hydrolase CwlO-like protein
VQNPLETDTSWPVRDGRVWYVRAAVRGRNHRLSRAFLVALTGLLLVAGLPATGPAQSPGAAGLKEKGAELQRRSQAALLDLYALGSRLDRARAELGRLDGELAGLARKQASARREYRAAVETQANAQLQLGGQLRLLYEQDQPDPIAVILGAESLQEAIDGLDSIHRITRATESVIDQAKRARRRVTTERTRLAAQVSRTNAARNRVAAGAADLEQARAERTAYLTQLRQEQALNAAQIADLEARAAQAQQRAQQVTAQVKQQQQQPQQQAQQPQQQAASPPPATTAPSAPPAPEPTTTFETPSTAAPGEPPPAPVESVSQSPSTATATPAPGPPRSGGTMTVLATAYCLPGKTATGLPVGPGIVAVDPSVIPLGTRMRIPGYGDGVAADVGGGVHGAHIDVWMASCSDAAAFTRTVTITFL